MNLDTLSLQELFNEISELAREQGVATREDWDSLCREAVESHEAMGELNDDQNLEGWITTLGDRWPEYQESAGPESASAIDEDPEAPRA